MEEQSRNSTYSLIGSLGLEDRMEDQMEDQMVCRDLTGDDYDYLLYSCVKLYLKLKSQNVSIKEREETGLDFIEIEFMVGRNSINDICTI